MPPLQTADAFDLAGRVALVTGGSRGLGRSIVLGLASAGADVVIASRSAEACQAVADEVEATTGREAMFHACHVGRWHEIDALVDAAYARFDHIDVLVNNAGMSPLYDEPASISEELWHKVLDVNLTGPFRLSALIGTRMSQGAGGSIVNISSVGSIYPTGDILPYAAAKAGLNALTTGFAHAFGPRVRVNCVLPGMFLTDVSKSWDGDQFAERSMRFALERGGSPDEIVGAVIYLASDAASYTTGAHLQVDGGYVRP
jgi:NAD(P)-dependent dehydrogenase (short-subunit alcohol dehydrogenase family)